MFARTSSTIQRFRELGSDAERCEMPGNLSDLEFSEILRVLNNLLEVSELAYSWVTAVCGFPKFATAGNQKSCTFSALSTKKSVVAKNQMKPRGHRKALLLLHLLGCKVSPSPSYFHRREDFVYKTSKMIVYCWWLNLQVLLSIHKSRLSTRRCFPVSAKT